MVTLIKYGALGGGEKYNVNQMWIDGLSTDAKPTATIDGMPIPNGSVFTEVDTGKTYMFDKDNTTWYEVSLGGGGGGGGSGTSNYNALSNRPQINGTTLTGNKTGSDLGLQDKVLGAWAAGTATTHSTPASTDTVLQALGKIDNNQRLDENNVSLIKRNVEVSQFNMQQGYFSVSNNVLSFNSNSTTRISTDNVNYVSVVKASEISVPTGYKFYLVALVKADNSIKFNAGWLTGKYLLDPTLNYAITIGKTDDSTINPDDINSHNIITINEGISASTKALEGVRKNNIISSLNLYNAYYANDGIIPVYSRTILTMASTEYIICNENMYVRPSNGYKINVIKYNKSTHELIGLGGWKTADVVMETGYAYKIMIARSDGANITTAEAEKVTIYTETDKEVDDCKDAIGITNISLVRGYWKAQATPAYLYSTTRLCTPDNEFIIPDTTIFLTPKEGYKIGVFMYDNTNNYLKYETWSNSSAIPLYSEYKYRINFAKNDDTTITLDDSTNLIVTINTDISLAVNAGVDVGVTSLNKDKESLVIQASMSRSAAVTQDYSVLEFIHFSDIHLAYKNWIRVCEYIDAFSDYLSFAIHTGDYVGSNQGDYFDHYRTKPQNINIYNCVGNHDSLASGSTQVASAPQASTYNLLFGNANVNDWGATFGSVENAMYYYKDFADAGIRLVVIDQYYWDTTESQWLDSVLADANENDLAVITAAHTQPSVITTAGTTFYSEETWTPDETINPTAFETNLLTFIDNGGTHICHICGHHHHDKIGYTSGGILVFMIECATTDTLWNDSMRVENTKCFDAFNVMAVDRNLGLIKVVRIGNNSNSRLQGKNVLCYDYINKAIISNY